MPMSRKIKGFALDSKARMEDAKARSRHQSLMQDYEDLLKEFDVMKSQLDAAKQMKLILAAEVRFLRKRHRFIVEANTTRSMQEQPPVVHASTYEHQPKGKKKKQLVARKEASKSSLPSGLVTNSKKQRKTSQQLPEHVAGLEANRAHKRKANGAKEGSGRSLAQNYMPLPDLNHRVMARDTLDLNQKQGRGSSDWVMAMRLPIIPFDLNQDSTPRIRGPSMRAPIIDLNEISTGDEDFYINVNLNEFEESTKGGLIGLNEEQPSELNLSSVCRNSGEGPSRVGKRKISWQDPVALRV